MSKGTGRLLRLSLLSLLASVSLLALACSEGDDDATGDDGGSQEEIVQYRLGVDSIVVAGGGSADNISAIEFAPDGRIFYAEQWKPNTSDGAGKSTAAIRIVNQDGSLQTLPFLEITVAEYLGLDWGLTGLALDPDFDTNHYVYAFYTEFIRNDTATNDDGSTTEHPVGRPTLLRITESNGTAGEQVVLSDDFPETDVAHPGYNANGEIHFGPDGMLYASLGDYDQHDPQNGNPGLVRDRSTPIGKLLRMNPDGSPAADNPFVADGASDPRVYAYGFREPFAFTWDAEGNMYGNDNTTVSCEELNLIGAGDSYGWPEMGVFPFSDCGIAPGEQAVYHFTREGKQPGDFLSFVEVSGMAPLTGSVYPEITDGIMVCESQRSQVDSKVTRGILRRLLFDDARTVSGSDIVVNDCKGQVAVNAGEIYYSNSSELRKLIPNQANPSVDAIEPTASE